MLSLAAGTQVHICGLLAFQVPFFTTLPRCSALLRCSGSDNKSGQSFHCVAVNTRDRGVVYCVGGVAGTFSQKVFPTITSLPVFFYSLCVFQQRLVQFEFFLSGCNNFLSRSSTQPYNSSSWYIWPASSSSLHIINKPIFVKENTQTTQKVLCVKVSLLCVKNCQTLFLAPGTPGQKGRTEPEPFLQLIKVNFELFRVYKIKVDHI